MTHPIAPGLDQYDVQAAHPQAEVALIYATDPLFPQATQTPQGKLLTTQAHPAEPFVPFPLTHPVQAIQATPEAAFHPAHPAPPAPVLVILMSPLFVSVHNTYTLYGQVMRFIVEFIVRLL